MVQILALELRFLTSYLMYVASICLCVKFMEIKEHEPPSITDTNHYLGKPRINVLKAKKVKFTLSSFSSNSATSPSTSSKAALEKLKIKQAVLCI